MIRHGGGGAQLSGAGTVSLLQRRARPLAVRDNLVDADALSAQGGPDQLEII